MALIQTVANPLALGGLLACLGAATVSAATPEDARRAYDAGRFTDAMGIWAELSRQGNVEAEFGLGLLYDLGNGIPADPEAAFIMYRLAADAGMPEAQFNVGAMYYSGHGVERSLADAALWYARSAAHGNHRAQYDLGLLYQDGEGVPRNPAVAAAWFQAAASGGLTAAAARLKTVKQDRPSSRTDPILPVVLVAPEREASVSRQVGYGGGIELVWTAPPEPWPVQYAVEVRELGAPTAPPLFSAIVPETAVVASLPLSPGAYFWSVDLVSRDGLRVTGGWSWFSVDAAESQSVASAPSPSGLGK